MFERDDTIVAIATPPGRGGIGVVRLSGPSAASIAATLTRSPQPFVPRHATLTHTYGTDGVADQAIVTSYPAPHSYTGEDVVEISTHGSQVLLRSIVERAMTAGARLAEPGEFTFRAYLNGKLDLVQAEAVRDLVDAVTPLQARAAYDQLEGTLTARIAAIDATLLDLSARLEASLDFPDEGYHFVDPTGASSELGDLIASIDALLHDSERGRLIREGASVAIVGRPNSGKSSLFNQLAGHGRAIVTEVPGTTRDLITEVVDMEGIPVTLVDTAGLREAPGDEIEAEGMSRTIAAHGVAGLAVVVLDSAGPITAEDERVLALTSGRPRVIVANKADLRPVWDVATRCPGSVSTSAKTGAGVDELRRAIGAALTSSERERRDTPAITNVRHASLLRKAREALERAAGAVQARTPEEFVALDIAEARGALEEVTGARTPDDVLRVIFERFCIGK